ncbi:Protein of unknown function, partial [Gryllus bimaculatus]
MDSVIMFGTQYILSMAIITFFNIKALQTGNSYVHFTRYWFAFKFFYNTSANQIDYNRKCSQEVAKSADQAFVIVDGDNLGKNEVMVKDIIDVLLPALAAEGRVPELGAHAALLLAAAAARAGRNSAAACACSAACTPEPARGGGPARRLAATALPSQQPAPGRCCPRTRTGARLLRQLCSLSLVRAAMAQVAVWRWQWLELRWPQAWRAGRKPAMERGRCGAWWRAGAGAGRWRGVRPPPAPPSRRRRLRSRADLTGVTFRAVSGFFRFERIGTLSQLRFAADLFEEIWCSMEEYYNFTTIWISRNYTEFGIKLSNGSWGDVIGTLMDGGSDVGIGDVSFTRLRKEVVDFLDPVFNP